MVCKVGSYTGNGQDNKQITGVGFQPELVIIRRQEATANYLVFRTSTMAANSTGYLARPYANFAGGIKTFIADGFTVGTDFTVNASGGTYHYLAFRDDGANDFKVGYYDGNGADNRDITGIGFQPDLVAVKAADDTAIARWRTASNSGDQSMSFGGAADVADAIQAILSDGFQIGTEQNVSGKRFHYFAFRTISLWTKHGTYPGTGSDNRSVSGLGFRPNVVWVKVAGTVRASHRPSSLAGDWTLFFDASNTAADFIQALETDGFQVGTQQNVNGSTYRYYAWKEGSSKPPAEAGGPAVVTIIRRRRR